MKVKSDRPLAVIIRDERLKKFPRLNGIKTINRKQITLLA